MIPLSENDAWMFKGKGNDPGISSDFVESWYPPAQGTKKRDAMPASCFLDSKNKKYPYKVKKNGKWVASKQGLQAAKSRAAQQHRQDLVKKADNIMSRNFGKNKKS